MGPDVEQQDGRYCSALDSFPKVAGRYVVRFRGKRGCLSSPYFNDWDGKKWRIDNLHVAKWQSIQI